MRGHKLIIACLRDLDASCECGMWSIVSTRGDDSTTTETLRKWATEKHREHVRSVKRRREAKAPPSK